jgi:phosphohistidine swiveling domain-containing protein
VATEYVISLHDPAARGAAVAGEKAAALARLLHHDVPVPDGFVVPAAVSAEAMAELSTEIETRFASAGDDLSALEAASESVRELIADLQVSPGLGDAISSAFAGLGDGAVVAVRSSGTAEDLPGASFAGQYDSFLNVTSSAQVIEQLVDVWASLYSAHAVAYRRHAALPVTGVTMAVLVQQQVDATASGVLFTRDPVSGIAGRMVVNAALGLGEGVVAGEVPSDSFAIDSDSLTVIDRTVVAKTSMVAAQPGGGVAVVPVPEAQRDAPALTDEQLKALGTLALRVREIEGGERDIEFAVAGDEVTLLQARPVTGLDQDDDAQGEFVVDWDDPEDQQYAWMLAAGDFGATPVHRFAQDLRRASAEHSKRVFNDTGVPMARGHILTFANGYPYARGPKVAGGEVKRHVEAHIVLGREYIDRGTSIYKEVIEPEVLRLLEELGPFRRAANESLASRFAFLERAIEVNGRVMSDLHWRQLARPFDSPEWPQIFRELTGLPEIDAGTLLQSVENATSRMVRRLRGLARIVQGDDALRAAFAARDFERMSEPALRTRPATQRFRRRFSALLRDVGRRNGRSYGSSTGFSTPTWNLDHSIPLRLVASYAEQDLDELDARERAARQERLAATAQARAGIEDGESRRSFDTQLRAAHERVRFMEGHNAIMEQGVAGVIREAIWWMGDAFVRRNRLDSPDDAMHLSLDELREATREEGDLRPLIREREAEYARQERLSPPAVIGDGKPPRMPEGFGEKAVENAGIDGTILRGTPASRGRHTGRARVYQPGNGGGTPELEAGDILVARNAGQDWTPILSLLGGIVLDQGAVFQHAALVAREYRIPAVLQTKEATTVITDGSTITIDGTAGTVELAP